MTGKRAPPRAGLLVGTLWPSGAFARLVWPLSLIQLISWGTLYYSFSLFLTPMEHDLGWQRGELTGGLTLGIVISGLASPLVGRLIDRGQARLVMTLGSLLGAGALFAWAEVETVAGYYCLWAVLGIALAATLYEPAFAVLIRRLGDRARQGIAAMTLIGGFASTLFIPICHLLIESLGWRDALLVLAGLNLALAAAAHWFILTPEAPDEPPQVDDATPAPTKSLGGVLAEASGQPAFWYLLIAFTGCFFTVAALTFHMVPLLAEHGHGTAAAVTVIAVIGPAQVAGRILVTLIVPGLGLLVAGVLALGLPALSLLVLQLGGESFALLLLFGICLGMGNGIATIVRANAVVALFARTSFGAINGALHLPISMARAFAPSLAALLWATAGSYGPVLWALFGVSAAALVAFCMGIRRGAQT